MKYRAEIDGLRALAVLPVILFHAGIELFSGGFVGVDIFFCISGYLITTILIEDIENERFSIVSFYERRARRILPALFVMMLLCIPFAWIWMLPSQMGDFLLSLVAVSFFASNILFWRESDYFAVAAEEKPLLHTWSLAVEEQWYLAFPIILILGWRFGRNRMFWMILVTAAISLALSEWGWRYKASANFYLAPTRAWELLAGSIAAFIVQKQGVKKSNPLSFLGLAAIIFSVLFFDRTTPVPSLFALVPVLGVVLIIIYGDEETLAAKILSNKILVSIGLISYSAYLWHQPLFAFAKIRLIEHPPLPLTLALSVGAISIAYFSWRWVEKPFRDKTKFNRNLIFGLSVFGMATFTFIGLLGHFYAQKYDKIWLTRQTQTVQNMYEVLSKANPSSSNWGALGKNKQEIAECVFNVRALNEQTEKRILSCNERHGKGLLVLGDSHAIDLFGVVASRQEHPFLIGVTQGGCRPHDNHDSCHYDRVSGFIHSHPDVFGLAIFEQAGHHLLLGKDGSNGSRRMFSDLPYNEAVSGLTVDKERIRLTTEYLYSLSKIIKVNWFLPRAEPHIPMQLVLNNGCYYKYSLRPNLYETFELLDEYIANFVRASFSNGLQVISQNSTFRFKFPDDFLNCDTIYWSDGDHLSAAGEEHFGKRITPELFE